MNYMGIEALHTKPKTTTANKEHYKYPYLLKDFRDYAGRVNQVRSTDITYIKLETGFVYLAAIIDWHSKKILSWKLSNSMDISLVKSVLNEALALYPTPEYKNIKALNRAIEKYMNSYNQRRLHSAIGYKTPNEVYYQADNNLDAKGVKSLPLVS